ncbi:MAG: PAS domain S-box protein [Prolixibacteraceae bacterium]|nr:PAS domain S-box protein [Prolixibacteraceae bacterium]
MNNFASELFLVTTSLSQMKNSKQVVKLFLESINELFPDLSFHWHGNEKPTHENYMPVTTRKRTYGYIEIDGIPKSNIEQTAHLQNAIQMLALILEKNDQDILLNEQKNKLQKIVQQQTIDLSQKNRALQNANKELTQQNKTLKKLNRELNNEIIQRKVLERKLNDSDKFFNHSVDMLCIAGFDGYFKVLNPAWEKTLGWSKEELLSRPWNDFVHPDDVDATNNIKSTIVDGRIAYQFVNRYVCKDGSVKWLSWNSFPSDEEEIMFGVARDITEYRLAQDNLKRIEWMLDPEKIKRENNNKTEWVPEYKDLTELNTNGLIKYSVEKSILNDLAGDYLSLLETSSAIYEKNGDYALGLFSSGWCRFLDSASRKLCNTEDNYEALKSGKWLCHESCWNNVSKRAIVEGRPVDIGCSGGINLYAVPIYAYGDIIGAINFGYGNPPTDEGSLKKIAKRYRVDPEELLRQARKYEARPPVIVELAKMRLKSSARLIGTLVERKLLQDDLNRSEENARESAALLEGVFDAIPDIIGIQDTNHNIISYNKAGYKFLNIQKGDEKGKRCFELIGRTKQCDECATTIAIKTKKAANIEKYVPEMKIWLEARSYPILNEKGEVALIIEHLRDITDRKRIEQELISSKEKAEESDRLKTSFLANLSHEIRTPMNSIMGFASLLPEEESREQMCQYANIIVNNSEQLVHIIDDIVLYSRLQTRLLSYVPSEFVINGFLEDIKHSFNLPEYQKGVELIVEPGESLIRTIKTDYEKLRQVLTNLVSNAFKYTTRGSITLGCKLISSDAVFFVRDTGIGISPDEKEKIFDRFYRGSNVDKGNIGGTGLGLSIVAELMDLLDGKIWVESETGKGSTFFILLQKSLVQ